MNMGKSNLDIFSETLLEIARQDRDVVVLTSDSRGSGRLENFFAELPEQAVEIGIAEQNLVGVAAGLASAGKKVFAVSPACFLTAPVWSRSKTMLLMRSAGPTDRDQRRGKLRRVGHHPPFPARSGGSPGYSQY